ncbi:hypothetical protein [Planktotalea arctica]|uniref:hypothetical protein n=1 Tax=Planktotalea arctica TaxID=1481893 RepID=UPI000A172B19|nr:hypothetical protein [Planktotalea arctica]
MNMLERIILALAIALYAGLNAVQIIYFGPPFGASAAPDLRLTGYTPQEVHAFLEHIAGDGRAVFFGLFRTLDTVFPPVLAVALVIVLKRVRPEFGRSIIGLFSLLALGYMFADLVENKFLSDLETSQDFRRTASVASMMTTVKYGLLGFVFLCLSVAAVTKRRIK